MLDTRFPRPEGDVGNPCTWAFPAIYETLPAATPARVVRHDLDTRDLLQPCLRALHRLVGRGACLITTSCGFLALYQEELQRHSPVPVIASSLVALPAIQAALPAGRLAGVITFDSRELGERHLRAVRADPATPIAGVEDGVELYPVIREDRTALDTRRAAQDVCEAARQLQRTTPKLSAVLLECTNMPPYRQAVTEALGLPVHDVVGVVSEVYARLRAR